jgi:acetyl/propionyl-CoA carboxylase alpha subunit|tara:strand:- start:403 stop:924 length:522 start_codon:yes stop_codon:yes gene_type:complete
LTVTVRFVVEDKEYPVDIIARTPVLVVAIDGRQYEVVDHGAHKNRRKIEINGQAHDFMLAHDGNIAHLKSKNRSWTVSLLDPRQATEQTAANSDEIRAPMPGVVVSIAKKEGDTVARGETVLTIESMKLQTNLTALRDGVIGKIHKPQDALFDKGEVIASLVPETSQNSSPTE